MKMRIEEDLFPQLKIVCISRRQLTENDFTQYVRRIYNSFCETYSYYIDEQWFLRFMGSIYYYAMDVTQESDFKGLKEYLNRLDEMRNSSFNERIFFLSLLPSLFSISIRNLAASTILADSGVRKIVVEKPFGTNLQTALEIETELVKHFREKEIFRLDHVLEKKFYKDLYHIRSVCPRFDCYWNSSFINKIEIEWNESIGIEGRGQYYESVGALRDMVQNHILQTLSLVCMELPATGELFMLRNERARLIGNLTKFEQEEELGRKVIRGQYIGYREEDNVNPNSVIETFVRLELTIRSLRWKGTDVVLKTGKRMEEKRTRIEISFKSPQTVKTLRDLLSEFTNSYDSIIFDVMRAKIIVTDMHNNSVDSKRNSISYDKLFQRIISGDQSSFVSWEEIQASWQFIDHIRRLWEQNTTGICCYQLGSIN